MFLIVIACPAATWRNPKDGAEYVQLPAGFWMARTEVTVAQFRRFTESTGYRTSAEKAASKHTWRYPGFPQDGRHPVVWLSFADALAYVEWAGVDLPTEAEWDYASRAGSATRFYWGDEIDDRYLWHRGNSPNGTHPVARRRPNAWGLYDMLGNAWEFCRVKPPRSRRAKA